MPVWELILNRTEISLRREGIMFRNKWEIGTPYVRAPGTIQDCPRNVFYNHFIQGHIHPVCDILHSMWSSLVIESINLNKNGKNGHKFSSRNVFMIRIACNEICKVFTLCRTAIAPLIQPNELLFTSRGISKLIESWSHLYCFFTYRSKTGNFLEYTSKFPSFPASVKLINLLSFFIPTSYILPAWLSWNRVLGRETKKQLIFGCHNHIKSITQIFDWSKFISMPLSRLFSFPNKSDRRMNG